MASFVPPLLFNDYLSTGEATCYFPDEGSKKSIRKPVYEMYFWNRDVVEIRMVVMCEVSTRLLTAIVREVASSSTRKW